MLNNNRVFTCNALIYQDEGGGYYVLAGNLPGCVSQGETIEECEENIKEAFGGCLESYLEHGDRIPWGLNMDVGIVPVKTVFITVEINV